VEVYIKQSAVLIEHAKKILEAHKVGLNLEGEDV